ncbi:Protocadherin Fat 4 [Mactra antiquata]
MIMEVRYYGFYVLVLLYFGIQNIEATSPVFTAPPVGGASTSIPENEAAGATVYTFAVTDDDNAPNPLTTTISNNDHSTLFVISGSDLLVQAGATFDYETSPSYTLTFESTDGTNTVTSETLTITITDVNEAPAFTSGTGTIVIQDQTSIGTAVGNLVSNPGVTDPENDVLLFTISDATKVDVDGSTSELSTVVLITWGTHGPSFTATITASDGTLTDTFAATFNVRTVPSFTLPAADTTSIGERSPTGHTVYAIVTTDIDGETNPTLSIDSQTVANTFEISGTDLVVAATADLDYDAPGATLLHEVVLFAVDSSGLTGSATLSVSITDVTDPVFSSATTAEVAENSPSGTSVYTAVATSGSAITYSITSGNDLAHFTFDGSSGLLSTSTAPLDFTVTPSYTLDIQADDLTYQTTLTVTISVKTAPSFTLPAADTSSIGERSPTGHTVYAIVTTDEDGETNPTLSIDSQTVANTFEISGTDLVVAATADLDYDAAGATLLHEVVLFAVDSSDLTGSATLTVSITDVTDPVFSSATTAEVAENSPSGSSVYTAAATSGSAITYSIESGNDLAHFTFDGSSGLLSTSTASLDFTVTPSYTLDIQADDLTYQTTLTVTISVKTVPSFTLPAADTSSIGERSPTGHTVYAIVTTDEDGETNPTLSIDSQTIANTFEISGTDLVVAATEDLDYDATGATLLHEVVLFAEDTFGLTGSATLTVSITDVTDPVFSSSTNAVEVGENAPTGTSVYTAVATSGSAITYSITSGNDAGKFFIDGTSGELTTLAALDYATVSSYTLDIQADDTTYTTSITLPINLRSVPTMTDDTFELAESASPGDTVATLTSIDLDGDQNTFEIVSQTPSEPIGGFAISGSDLVTGATFDYDEPTAHRSFTVEVKVLDDFTPTPLSSTATFTVTITNVNDLTPAFSEASYTVSIKENSAVSGAIVLAPATDGDSGDTITYTIPTDTNGDFAIDANGAVTLLQSLVYDPAAFIITHTLRATDGGALHSAEASLVVTVREETDIAFDTSSGTTVDIAEDAGIDTTIYTVVTNDADEDTPTYTVSTHGDKFQINNDNTVSTLVTFDYETTTSYEIEIKAIDENNPPFTASITLTLSVTDVNDNAPAFSQATYTANALENVPAAGNDDSAFVIDSATGVISVLADTVLYSNGATRSFTVTAKDLNGGVVALSATATVDVTVLTAPHFTEPDVDNKNYNALESDTEFVVLVAVDDDTTGSLPSLVYSIVNQLPTADLIVLDSDPVTNPGKLILGPGTDLDVDVPSPTLSITLTVRVTDGDHNTDTTIVININDENDETPTFAENYNFFADETAGIGDVVGTVVATDNDYSAPNNEFTYSLTTLSNAGVTAFQISSSSGEITVAESLMGVTEVFVLLAHANDGTNDGTATINIVVVSDPIWSEPATDNFVYSIPESTTTAIGSSGIQIAATDTDNSPSALVYSIISQTPNSDWFVIDDVTGQIILNAQFDYETTDTSVDLVVSVTDGSTSVERSITINIDDVNDETPVFDPTGTYSFTVSENAAIGFTVGTISATDDDITVSYSTIAYTLDVVTDFNIDSVTGEITAVSSLIGVSTPFSLTVTASDGTLSATQAIQMTVKTDPVFTSPPSVAFAVPNIDDGTAAGSAFYLLAATDADGDALTYSIESITPNTQDNIFVVDGSTGQISIGTSSIDIDDTVNFAASYTIAVRVSDGTTDVDSSIVVDIDDINDKSPVFDSVSYSFSINDQAAIGDDVGSLIATDDDLTTQHNTITYSLTGTNVDDFTIDSATGQITTAVSMVNAPTPYTLTGTASDGTNEVTVTVTVSVSTVPSWVLPAAPETTITIDENTVNSVYGLDSTDTDGDVPTYTIENQTPATPVNLFIILGSEIRVGTTPLDFDSSIINPPYTLDLRVTDGTTNVDTSLIININDLNDHSPVFVNTPYQFTVAESASAGTSIGEISTTDSDVSSSYNTHTYTIVSGTGSTDFSVTSEGIVEVADAVSLDFSTQSSYSLTFQASDGVNTATIVVSISVKTAPQFTSPASAASLTLAENTGLPPYVFYVLVATDQDNDPLTYSIKSQTVTDFFKIDESSGNEVILNSGRVLDYEATQLHTLIFEVTDGTNDKVSSAVLEITVTDVNDNSPTFAASSINVLVKNTSPVGSTVATIQASDADSPTNDNNVITYSIISGNTNGNFDLTSDGYLILENEYNTGDSDTMVIRATDGGAGSLFDDVTVIIGGTTPSNPVLIAPVSAASAEISETAAIGTSVYAIHASDADGDDLIYTIASSNPPSEFRLVGNVLQTKLALDYETTTSYELVFEVDDDDGDESNKLTSAVLTITVLNENDHFPVFPREFYSKEIMERRTEVVKVLKVQAKDKDAGEAGDLTYSIITGDYLGQFTVDDKGQVSTTNLGLSRDVQIRHLLGIQAKDSGTPPKADSYHLEIIVRELKMSGASYVKANLIVMLLPFVCMLRSILCSA